MPRYHVPRITVTLAGVEPQIARAAADQLRARISAALRRGPGHGAAPDAADHAGALADRIARQVAEQCQARLQGQER